MSGMQRTFSVPAGTGGARLDVFLTDALTGAGVGGWSRSRVQKAIKDGHATVDGRALRRTGTPVEDGWNVAFELDDGREVSTDVGGRRIVELPILFEDEHVIVIDKPAGIVSHPSPRQLAGTVSDLAVERFGPLPEVQGEDRPGIVHRLDRLTSGVMVLGRTREALEDLKRQFKARTVQKTYHAVVHGTPRYDTEWLDWSIEPSPKKPDRMRAVRPIEKEERPEWWTPPPEVLEAEAAERAKRAETFIETLETYPGATLVAAQPKTGRTHQIRVHLQAAGLPIVGDRVYGPRGALETPLPKEAPKMERPALHARRLEFDHPGTGERVTFEAEVPADMAALLEALRGAVR